MPSLAELRQEAVDAAEDIQRLTTGYNERRQALDADETARDLTTEQREARLWPEAERREYDEANTRYDNARAAFDREEHEARVVARAAEVGDWLGRARTDPNHRPQLDDQLPGEQRSYGDLGLENPDQARALDRRQQDLTLAFQHWAGHGVPQARMTEQHREACQRLDFDPTRSEIELRHSDTGSYRQMQSALLASHPARRERVISEMIESRALSSGLGASGGFLTVPASVVQTIEMAMISFGAFLDEAETITTETGEQMGWPVGDDTSNEASYTDENPTVAPSDVEPSFEAVKWGAFDLQSGFIKVPFRLFRDTFTGLELIIANMIGERFGRKLSGECTTGAAKIRGIITRAPVGNTTAGATAITYDDVVDLDTSLDPAFIPGARYMFHNNVLGELRKLADSQNRPLWISNIAAGVPDTFNGRGLAINQKMSSAITTGQKTMVLGQLRAYKLRRVGPALRLRRLVERFAEFDQTAFLGFMSADGNLLRPNANAACPVQVLQQA